MRHVLPQHAVKCARSDQTILLRKPTALHCMSVVPAWGADGGEAEQSEEEEEMTAGGEEAAASATAEHQENADAGGQLAATVQAGSVHALGLPRRQLAASLAILTWAPLPPPLQRMWVPPLPCACPRWTSARCLGRPRGSACPAPQPWASARGLRPPPTASRPCLAAARPASCAAASAALSSGTSSATAQTENLARKRGSGSRPG